MLQIIHLSTLPPIRTMAAITVSKLGSERKGLPGIEEGRNAAVGLQDAWGWRYLLAVRYCTRVVSESYQRRPGSAVIA